MNYYKKCYEFWRCENKQNSEWELWLSKEYKTYRSALKYYEKWKHTQKKNWIYVIAERVETIELKFLHNTNKALLIEKLLEKGYTQTSAYCFEKEISEQDTKQFELFEGCFCIVQHHYTIIEGQKILCGMYRCPDLEYTKDIINAIIYE